MHRIDSGTAAPGGLFTAGDPNVGTPATVVTPEWLNAVQAELEAVAVVNGDALSKPSNDQVLKAIRGLIAAALPAGAVAHFARVTAPAGWLVCDGSAVSRSAYPALFSAIGVTFGAGDGATTFALPDLRGEFLRGADLGRGVDAGRTVGSTQGQQTAAHKHVVPWGESGSAAGSAPFGRTASAGRFGTGTNDSDNFWVHTNDGQDYDGQVNPAGVIGVETRPRNVALLACIKA